MVSSLRLHGRFIGGSMVFRARRFRTIGFPLLIAAGLLVVVSCDLGSPAPASPTSAKQTPIVEATPPFDPGSVVTVDDAVLSKLLTQLPTVLTPTSVPLAKGVDAASSIYLYGEVVDALLGEKVPDYVYISPFIGRGEQLDDPDESNPIPTSLLASLTVVNGHPKYELLEFAKAVGPLEDGGKVKNGGAFITLGPIVSDPQDAGVVDVRGSIYHMVGQAEGLTFRFRRDSSEPKGWKLLGSTQDWSE